MSRYTFPIRIIALLCLVLALSACAAAESAPIEIPAEHVYGFSESGRPLTCIQLGNAEAPQALLLTFGIHGFEDAYDHDGDVLRLIAYRIIGYFSEHQQELSNLRLCVVPSTSAISS